MFWAKICGSKIICSVSSQNSVCASDKAITTKTNGYLFVI